MYCLPSVLLAVLRKHLYGACGPTTVSHQGSDGDSPSLRPWGTSCLTRFHFIHIKSFFFSPFRFSRCEKKSEENLRISPNIFVAVVVKFYLIRMKSLEVFSRVSKISCLLLSTGKQF